MGVVTLQRSKHYIEDLNKINQGAAVGISLGEQCPQQQQAEREPQAVGCGVYGGRRGGIRGLRLAAAAWARGVSLSPLGLHHAGLDGTPRARFPLSPSLATQTSLL